MSIVGRANLDGTGVNQNFVTEISNGLGDIAVDGTHIYGTGTGTIRRANLDRAGVDQSFISVTGGSSVSIALASVREPGTGLLVTGGARGLAATRRRQSAQ